MSFPTPKDLDTLLWLIHESRKSHWNKKNTSDVYRFFKELWYDTSDANDAIHHFTHRGHIRKSQSWYSLTQEWEDAMRSQYFQSEFRRIELEKKISEYSLESLKKSLHWTRRDLPIILSVLTFLWSVVWAFVLFFSDKS